MTKEDTQSADQTVQQAAQSAEQAAQEAKQAAQQISEAAGQTQRAIVDASRTAGSQEVGAEREMETGSDEFFKASSQINYLNAKRTYDEYQQESLAGIRENRSLVDRLSQNAVTVDQQIHNVAIQALQNAVETANMVGKQAVRHGDIAIDRQWNVDEQGYTVAEILRDETFKAALAAAVAKVAQPTT